jgi:chitinase
MLHFAKELRRLMNESPHRPDINKYLLTASPRCVIPKPTKNGLLNGGLALDAIFVRFYNDICGLESFTTSKPSFNFEAWSQWAEQLTTLENVKVFLGVPASPSATTSGYATTRELREIVALVKTSSSFGGLMLWEASQLDENWGFMKGVAAILGAMPSQEIEPAAPIEKPRIELGHRPKSESADFYQHVLVAKSGKSLAGSLSTKSTSVAVRNGRFRRLILRQ